MCADKDVLRYKVQTLYSSPLYRVTSVFDKDKPKPNKYEET